MYWYKSAEPTTPLEQVRKCSRTTSSSPGRRGQRPSRVVQFGIGRVGQGPMPAVFESMQMRLGYVGKTAVAPPQLKVFKRHNQVRVIICESLIKLHCLDQKNPKTWHFDVWVF